MKTPHGSLMVFVTIKQLKLLTIKSTIIHSKQLAFLYSLFPRILCHCFTMKVLSLIAFTCGRRRNGGCATWSEFVPSAHLYKDHIHQPLREDDFWRIENHLEEILLYWEIWKFITFSIHNTFETLIIIMKQ